MNHMVLERELKRSMLTLVRFGMKDRGPNVNTRVKSSA
jgi:hypothetical protein